jgi:hypothetical protein
VLAFDRSAARILPLGTILRDTTPANQGDLMRHLVERVVIEDRDVARIEGRP